MDHYQKLTHFYENEGKEDLRFQKDDVHYLEFLTATKYLEKYLPKNATILDNCAGTGAYSFHLAQNNHQVTATDIVPYNVKIIQERQSQTPILKETLQADCQHMPMFSDNSFNAVLCMGALYHLPEPQQRKQAITESLRVLSPDGLLACTYMNRYAVIMGNAVGDLDNILEILTFLKDGHADIFYTSTPEEMLETIKEFPVEVLCHVALDGMAAFLLHFTQYITKDGLQHWRQYHLATCEAPSLLGASYHNMLILRKK